MRKRLANSGKMVRISLTPVAGACATEMFGLGLRFALKAA